MQINQQNKMYKSVKKSLINQETTILDHSSLDVTDHVGEFQFSGQFRSTCLSPGKWPPKDPEDFRRLRVQWKHLLVFF